MTTILRTVSLATLAALGLFTASPARADHNDYERVDRLALKLQEESRQLYSELRSASGDRNLQSARYEAGQIYRLASRIHDTAHYRGSPRQLDRDVHALKDLVHHVEEHLAFHRHFRRHVDQLDRLTHDLEDAIHRLDGRSLSSDRPVYYGPSYGARPGSSGISFGGSGFSIRLGR
jgi:hypothetical protein